MLNISRLSALIAQCSALRAKAFANGDVVSFHKYDRATLRLVWAETELRRGNEKAARAFAWSVCDLLHCIH